MTGATMTKLYVSGGMSHYPGFNFPAFAEATKALRLAGYEVEDPGEFGVQDGWDWTDYLKKDLHIVIDSDGVATLPNWQESRGACLEVSTAQALHIPVLPVNQWIYNAEDKKRAQQLLQLEIDFSV